MNKKHLKKAIKATSIQSLVIYIFATLITGFVTWDLTIVPVNTYEFLLNIGDQTEDDRAGLTFFYLFYVASSIGGYYMYYNEKNTKY